MVGRVTRGETMFFRSCLKYWRRRKGATAVEFSLIAVPLVMLMFGVIEISMIFTKQGVLEYATSQAAREIRTGQAQQSGAPEDAFRLALCNHVSFMIDCDDIAYEVQTMDSFSDANEAPPPSYDEDGNLESQEFDAGESSGVVLIRTVYRHPIVTPMMQPLLSNSGSATTRLMISTVVLQSEPYEFEF